MKVIGGIIGIIVLIVMIPKFLPAVFAEDTPIFVRIFICVWLAGFGYGTVSSLVGKGGKGGGGGFSGGCGGCGGGNGGGGGGCGGCGGGGCGGGD